MALSYLHSLFSTFSDDTILTILTQKTENESPSLEKKTALSNYALPGIPS